MGLFGIMRNVNDIYKEFLALPDYTVYRKFFPASFESNGHTIRL